MGDVNSSYDDSLAKVLEEMFKPKVSEELAIDLAARLYGLEVTDIKPMNSFSDQNFLIKVSKDHRNPHIKEVSEQGYTLKIINTFKSNMENHFDTVHAGMLHLFEKGLRVPQPVKNLEGKTWQLEVVPLQIKDKEPDKVFKCGVHLLTYIPGVPVATFKNTEDNFFEWGTLLAKFHNALEDLDCPALNNKVIFSNVKHFHFIRAFLNSLEEGAFDEEARLLVEKVLEKFSSELEPHLNDLPQGIIHGDFNDHNILAQLKDAESDEKTYTADGILDFDDMHGGCFVWDLGLMLGHVLMVDKTTDALEAAGHAVAGYRSVRHLSELEMSLLKICMECRISMMTLISSAAKEEPSNTYIVSLSAMEPKKNMLNRLAHTEVEEILCLWTDIIKKRNLEVK